MLDRERSGIARRVSVSMQDAVYASLSSSLGMVWGTQGDETPPPRTGNRHGGMAESPYNVYPTTDGWIAIICVGEKQWQKLCHVMEQPALLDDPRFASLKERVTVMDEVDEIIGNWTAQRSKEQAFSALMGGGVPCAPVRTLTEVMEDENMHARGSLKYQDHPTLGRIVVQHSPLRYEGTQLCALEPSHDLGADTERVLAELSGAERPMLKNDAAQD